MKASIAWEASYASRKLMELLKTNTLRKVKEGDAEWRFVGKKKNKNESPILCLIFQLQHI